MVRRQLSRWKRFRNLWSSLRIAGAVSLALGVIVGRIGYLNRDEVWIQDLYPNVAVDLAGIAMALLVVDVLSERRTKQEMKSRLTREMGSSDNGIALKAIAELEAHGWVRDGSLANSNFYKANLEGAWLDKAKLRAAGLHHANLANAFLASSDLREAKFFQSNLEGATLSDSDVQGAHFGNANLRGARIQNSDLRGAILADADLSGAVFLSANLDGAIGIKPGQLARAGGLSWATMPDGSKYDGRFSLAYDLEYASNEGYEPSDPKEMAEWYEVSKESFLVGQAWAHEHLNSWERRP